MVWSKTKSHPRYLTLRLVNMLDYWLPTIEEMSPNTFTLKFPHWELGSILISASDLTIRTQNHRWKVYTLCEKHEVNSRSQIFPPDLLEKLVGAFETNADKRKIFPGMVREFTTHDPFVRAIDHAMDIRM